ncbi:RsfA family transcriptional regulator [Bacillus sp. S/N-304-OC-R1]|uniref:RsfA family transcriptional regulator n=1 Tax=Bacillus sp. S/N-304-OC-R1 TaxID=2758034 RepID=UPI001C8D5075|nr:RsfA family transcriptional regulator [Bacillus sp. S/N-304-OC-R1]MBY0123296.1 RsfA family transcriptional regulator [Bacillus sp. S/N-304-OC-R1]
MKVRQDAWTEENDLLLAETVLRHVREGSTQLNAFEEVGDRLDRTSAACGFRWNAVVRHQYEKALQLAKKQRKQRQRLLGKEQGGKKKLLYSPPVPSLSEVETITPTPALVAPSSSDEEAEIVEAIETRPVPVYSEETSYTGGSDLNLDRVISYLQTLKHSSIQLDILRNENERLKRENAQIKSRNNELEEKINHLEENTETIQEDYETLMKIMNRARKLVLFEEEERPATKFKMDRNGNLEKLAE